MRMLIGLAALLLIAAPAVAEISVNGTGIVSAKPDMARLTVTVEGRHRAAATATRQCTQRMTKALGLAEAQGVAKDDLRTFGYRVEPEYKYPEDKPRVLVGYIVTHSLSVTVRQFDRLGIVLAALAEEPNTFVSNVSFDITEKTALMKRARQLAVNDAMTKANTLATQAGVRLGSATNISESRRYYGRQASSRMDMASKNAPGSVPIAGGKQQLTVDISMEFEIVATDPNQNPFYCPKCKRVHPFPHCVDKPHSDLAPPATVE